MEGREVSFGLNELRGSNGTTSQEEGDEREAPASSLGYQKVETCRKGLKGQDNEARRKGEGRRKGRGGEQGSDC